VAVPVVVLVIGVLVLVLLEVRVYREVAFLGLPCASTSNINTNISFTSSTSYIVKSGCPGFTGSNSSYTNSTLPP
jgi:hypothetical protein